MGLAAAVAALALLAPAGRSPAAIAPLTGDAGCLAASGSAATDCRTVGAIAGISGIALSPDGANAYLTARHSDTLSAFTRDPVSGRLDPVQCLSDSGADLKVGDSVCADADALDQPMASVVSPDGRHAYAVTGGSLISLDRGLDGRLTQFACMRAGAVSDRCPVVAPTWGTIAVAMAPGGTTLLTAAAAESNAVHAFRRDAMTGSLTHAGCLSRDGSDGFCADGEGLRGISGLVAAPGGRRAYAASGTDGTIVTIDVDPQEGPRQADCVVGTDPGAGPCRTLEGLAEPAVLAASPDGGTLFVSDRRRIDIVDLDAAGLPAEVVAGPRTAVDVLAVRPDGRAVAVGSNSRLAVYSYEGGKLERTGCMSSDAAEGCVKGPAFGGPTSLAWSPDGQNLYVTATDRVIAVAEPSAVGPAPARAVNGTVRVAVECPATRNRACSGRLRLRTARSRGRAAAAAEFRILPGRSVRVRVPMPASLRRRLVAGARAWVIAEVREHAGLPVASRRLAVERVGR